MRYDMNESLAILLDAKFGETREHLRERYEPPVVAAFEVALRALRNTIRYNDVESKTKFLAILAMLLNLNDDKLKGYLGEILNILEFAYKESGGK